MAADERRAIPMDTEQAALFAETAASITTAADDEGPGAPDHAAAKPAAKPLRGGAPVPGNSASDARGGGLPERSPGSPASQNRVASDSESENPILQYARACQR